MKTLVIGYGSIGKRHAGILAKDLGLHIEIVTSQDIQAFPSYPKLEDVDIDTYDYFVIASETVKHLDQLQYLDTKLSGKTILVEKPIFLPEQNYTPSGNNRIFIGYNLRYHWIIQHIKDLTTDEQVLFVHSYTGQYLPTWRERDYRLSYSADRAKGGGILMDYSHDIDYLQYLVGEIDIIGGVNDKISDLEMDADDIASVIGKSQSGTIVNFTIDCISKLKTRQIILHTNNKTIFADFNNEYININGEIIRQSTERNQTYRDMHEDVLFDKSTKHACTPKEACLVMQMIIKISSQQGM